MADQETGIERPTFNPEDHGLWARYIDGNNIAHGAWLRACAESGYVGTCRICGGQMRPRPPDDAHEPLVWYEADCIACNQTYAAPATRHQTGGRVLRRSSAHHHMPRGWWAQRIKLLRAADAGEG